MVVIALIACILLSSTLYTKKTEAANPPPFFSISILAPNTSTGGQWPTLMVEQLPKIGIGVDIFDHTGWYQIAPRTWGYPGPYPIPSYENGGYDILFVGWGFGLDFDPTELFDSSCITPNEWNFYQYNQPEMDWAIRNYTNSILYDNRVSYAKEIQSILYNELPQISIIYRSLLYPMTIGFDQNSWDGVLWSNEFETLENWTVLGQTEFHYGTPADMEDFHIYSWDSSYDFMWLKQIYTSMIKREPNTYKWINNLASSYSTIDGLTWNINIHPNAKWADGSALTTQDVNYSYHLLLDPSFVFGYSPPDILPYLNQSSITIINDYEFEITFLQPYLFHESNLDLDILPKHIWEGIAPANHTSQAATWALTDPNKLIGTGPYYLEEYNATNEFIHLKVNPYYDDWSGITPNFDDVYFDFYDRREIAFLALTSGACDMIDAYFRPRLNEIPPGYTYQLIDKAGQQEMAINCMHPIIGTGELCPISSPESGIHIRKAISHMVPRQVIVDEILDGIGRPGVTAWIPVSHGFDASLEPYAYSISSAKHHMRAAGYVYPEDNSSTFLQSTSILGAPFGLFVGSIAIVNAIVICFRIKKRRIG